MVTTAGAIEEDIMKCFAPTFVGRFDLSGAELRRKYVNRIGNLLIPTENYCKLEDWIMPILDQMLVEQNSQVQSFLAFLDWFVHNFIFL